MFQLVFSILLGGGGLWMCSSHPLLHVAHQALEVSKHLTFSLSQMKWLDIRAKLSCGVTVMRLFLNDHTTPCSVIIQRVSSRSTVGHWGVILCHDDGCHHHGHDHMCSSRSCKQIKTSMMQTNRRTKQMPNFRFWANHILNSVDI
jgi:hypothetical protein